MPFEEFMERFSIDIKGAECICVPGNDFENILRNVFCIFPVLVEPLLELGYLTTALDLDIQFNIICKPRAGEVA